MAEIPLTLLERRAPRGGQYHPAGAVGYPRLQAPPGGVAEALSRAGQSISHSLLYAAEKQQRERDASDTITVQDFTARATDDLLDWQQNLAVDQSLAPLELRNHLEGKRDELLASYSEQLPARLRPKFAAAFRQAAIQPVYTLDQVGVKRYGEQATATFEHRSDQLLRQTLQAPSDRDRQRLQGEQDKLIQDYAMQGLLAPEQVPVLKQKHRDAVTVAQLETQLRLDPKAVIAQLEQGPAANPTVPPEAFPKLLDQARTLHQQQLSWYDAAQRRADVAVQKAQQQNTGSLWAEFVRLDPTPANSEKLRTLLAQAEQQFKDGKISVEQYEQLSGRGRAMLDRSLQPGAEKDNIALERELTIALARAKTDSEIQAIQTQLLARGGELRPETIQRLNTAIDQRRQASHYSNTKEYRDGVDILVRAVVVPGTGMMSVDAMEKSERQRQLTLALDAYEAKMSQRAGQDVNAMKAEARGLAYRLRDLYLPLDLTGVPADVQKAANEQELAQKLLELQRQGVPEESLNRYRTLWRQQQERKPAVPTTPTTPRPAAPDKRTR